MRIVVDVGLCQGHAMCELEAPEVFRAPSGGPVEVLLPDVPLEHQEAVRAAVRYCPTRALSVEED
jgi:ferredoxin